MARWMTAPIFFALAACGGAEDEAIYISFQQHALECELPGPTDCTDDTDCSISKVCDRNRQQCVPGLQAKLEVTGVQGVCPLQVDDNRRVSGMCRGVPTGAIRDFRLVYHYFIDEDEDGNRTDEVQVATVLARLDLREETDEVVEIEFPQSTLMTGFDDDNDGRANIVEYCQETNPRG